MVLHQLQETVSPPQLLSEFHQMPNVRAFDSKQYSSLLEPFTVSFLEMGHLLETQLALQQSRSSRRPGL